MIKLVFSFFKQNLIINIKTNVINPIIMDGITISFGSNKSTLFEKIKIIGKNANKKGCNNVDLKKSLIERFSIYLDKKFHKIILYWYNIP